MTTYADRRVVPYSPAQMFALVADVERYPAFLPWCSRVKIRSRSESEGRIILLADMTVTFKVVHESFGSKVILSPDDHRIDVSYLEGPFRRLHNQWRFVPRPGEATLVDFFIDFEFKNRALGLLIGSVFHKAVEKLIGAFEGRARALYHTPQALTATRSA